MRVYVALRRLGVALVCLALAFIVVPPVAQAVFVPVPPAPNPGTSTNGIVRAVVLKGHVAYAGGDFTTVTGTNGTFDRARLAAWDLTTGEVLTGFQADTDAPVRALAVSGDSLYVGGDFRKIRALSRGRLAEVDAATGAVNTTFRNTVNGAVRALAVGGGRLFLGGSFSSVNSLVRTRLAAVDLASRQLVPDFVPSADAPVHALAATESGDRVYAGGTFLTLNGNPTPYLAGMNFNGQSAGTTFPLLTTYSVLGLDLNEDGSRVFAAHGGSGNQAAAYDTSTGVRLWRQRADGDVQAVAYHDGNVYFGFHEGFNLDPKLRLLVADARTGTLEDAFWPPVNSFFGIYSLDATNAGLLAGGEFTKISEVTVGRLAFFDASKGPTPPTTLLPTFSQWRYFDGSATPAGWSDPVFDDSAWAQGPAEFGFGEGDEATVIGYGGNATKKYLTSYYRRTFEWDGSGAFASLTISLLADDGAAVYVNGNEVLRDNLPTGALAFTTRAASDRTGANETVRKFTVDPSALVPGTNTIAVELHQYGPATSDASFNLGLVGNHQ